MELKLGTFPPMVPWRMGPYKTVRFLYKLGHFPLNHDYGEEVYMVHVLSFSSISIFLEESNITKLYGVYFFFTMPCFESKIGAGGS